MPENARRTAERFISTHFPNCEAALLSGSTARGDATETSDLDIVILHNETENYRKSITFEGWPVELFVQSRDSLDFYFQIEQEQGIPLLIRLCAEGIALKENSETRSILQEAKNFLSEGPSPWTEKKINEARYVMTYLLEDLEGSDSFNEDAFTVHALLDELMEFYLRTNQQWMGEGKWIYRSFVQVDDQMGETLVKSIKKFYQYGQKKPLIRLTDKIMEPYGGRYFDGFIG